MKCAAGLLFMMCLFPAEMNLSAVAAEPTLKSLAGTWSGGGFVRPNLFDKKQRVKCKLKATVDGPAKTILAGRCATANRSHKITLEIKQTVGGKKVTSIARVSGSAEAFEYLGRKSRTGFVMKIAKPFKQNGRTVSSTMSILLPNWNSLTISETITDIASGEKINAVSLTLKR